MNTIYKYLIITVMIAIGGFATAQTKADKKEQIASFRVAFITKELSLNSTRS